MRPMPYERGRIRPLNCVYLYTHVPMPRSYAWEIADREPLYRGYLSVYRLHLRHGLFRGGCSESLIREIVERGDCVAVVPYDPLRDRVVLIEQFRVGALRAGESPWLMEIVAGVIDPGEQPDAVARRETLEEAGRSVRNLERIGEFYTTPGVSSEKITLFLGVVDSAGVGGIHGLAEEHEDIRVESFAFADVLALMEQGRINSAIPMIGLQWLALNRERIRRQYAELQEPFF